MKSLSQINYKIYSINMTKTILLLSIVLVWSIASQPVESPNGIQKVPNNQNKQFFKVTDIGGAVDSLENQASQSQVSFQAIKSPVNIDLYTFGKVAFYLQQYFPYCKRCEKLEYFAFKYGNYYLTARSTFLRLQASTSSSPANNQLFIAEQQIDGTWAFKSLSQNKYIRASNDGTTINYQTFVGPWERWYIERHNDHVHIQSAQFALNWWIFDNFVLQQMNGGASPLKIEYFPKLQWLWNY